MEAAGLELDRFGAFPQRPGRGWDIVVSFEWQGSSGDRMRPRCFQDSHYLENEIFDRLQLEARIGEIKPSSIYFIII